MAEIRAAFFVEAEELLESLQDGLQLYDDGQRDDETINVVFRAVHSIKGGAGAFGLDELVQFAHTFETALDAVRSGALDPDGAAVKLFFRSADILADLVRAARDGTDLPADVTGPVLAALGELTGEEEEEEEVDFQPATLSLDLGGAGGDAGGAGGLDIPGLPPLPPLEAPQAPARSTWTIRFAPHDALLVSGNEPLYLLRALAEMGETEVSCDCTELPGLDTIDPEAAYLAWTIRLDCPPPEGDGPPVDEAAIREVFEFVDGLCDLEITAEAVEPPSDAAALPPLDPAPDTAPGAPADVAPAPIAAEAPTPAPADAPAAAAPPAPDLPRPAPDSKPAAKPAAAPAPEPRTATRPAATVRVDLERIDRLVNLVGELVINQAMLSQRVAEAGLPPNSPVATGLEEFMQLTRDIQESVMMIRAQPIKSLFQRMARIVREASSDVGKEVRFVTEGENTEVDKTVIERLADPLTHMIRNAVDHGLEKTEDRVAAGKPAEGRVTLKAAHRSGRILIEIADDGGGINRPRVREIAEERGLIAPDAQLTESEIDNLLFMPGFSTASEVSSLSGRGVGMDVVRSSIQALGGRVAITSRRGEGTTFSISLPLTLAVLDGMVVGAAGETLVVPLNAILETLTLGEEDLRALGPQTHVVQIRGGFVPLIDLGTELGYRAPLDNYMGSTVLLIGQEEGQRAAMVVDAIEDQRQVVIKGLEATYGRVPGIAAATILGDGQIALILDPPDLIAGASGRTRAANLPLAG